VTKDNVVGGSTVEEDFGIGACEALCRVFRAVVSEADGDGFGTVVVGFEDGCPEPLDLFTHPH
jgi:hypothetical protein